MRHHIVRLLLFAACLLTWLPPAASAQDAPPLAIAPTIVVRGEGRVELAPEIAKIRLSAIGRGEKTSDARKQSAEAMTAVHAALEKLGVPASAWTTVEYGVAPEYRYEANTQKLVGMMARNVVTIQIDDPAKAGAVIDAAAGADRVSVDSLTFDVRDRKAAQRAAFTAAVVDAAALAQAIAAGAQRSVGQIIKIQQEGVDFPDIMNVRLLPSGVDRTITEGLPTPAPPPPVVTTIIPSKIVITARVVLMTAVK